MGYTILFVRGGMPYRFVTESQDYTNYASGRVFYSLAGHPAFPARLASEIFLRCLAHRQNLFHLSEPVHLYDPCCGAAYHLCVLGFLHGESIGCVSGSDVDEKAVSVARRNLDLLQPQGLEKRIVEIHAMIERFGKESHREALQSATELLAGWVNRPSALPGQGRVFVSSALDAQTLSKNLHDIPVDVVFSDVPYGQHSSWVDSTPDPVNGILGALAGVLKPTAIVAVASDKAQKITHDGYRRIEQFQMGKRRVVIMRPGSQ